MLDSEINARFLLTRVVIYTFLLLNNSVHVILFNLKIFKIYISIGKKKAKAKAYSKPLLWDANYDRNYRTPLRTF